MATTPKKKFNINWLFLIVPLFFVIGIIVFLFDKDCYGQYCITGWEVLKIQWPSFWIWAVIGAGIAGVFGYLAYRTEQRGGATGRVILFTILALAFLCGPWGKACNDKANGGVTAPGYKNEAK